LSHVGGLSILVRSAIHATTVVLHPGWDTTTVAHALADDAITAVSLVPTTLARLLEAEARPGPSLRCVLVGGAPLPQALAARGLAAGFPIAHTYGLTEACSQVATSPVGEPETTGLPLDGTQVRIAPGGEILVSGPTVAPSAKARDGWLHTGDVGRLDSAGRLVVTGRRAETVVSGGENVAPAEVEAVLEAHPAVAEAAVSGRADPEWGEAVVATVVLRKGHHADAETLRAHCRASLAAYKVPKAFAFASRLPRTASGKLRRDAV
jgi:O-succinylbenzoic acid--CoA ligase